MVKDNYRAWQIDSEGFSDDWSPAKKLRFFAQYALLAPSGHNSQPWELTSVGDSIIVTVDPVRHLSEDGSGLLSVEPYISIGTFVEMFSLAGKGLGYLLATRTLSTDPLSVQIDITRKVAPQPQLLSAIVNRVSNRQPFKQDPIASKLLEKFVDTSLAGICTTLVTNRKDIEFVGRMTKQAMSSIMSKPLYRKELSRWVRTNFTRSYSGMPGFTHGFGGAQSLFSKFAVRHLPAQGPQAEHSKDLILESAALVIVSCADNKREHFLNAGRIYSQICILSQLHGIASSAMGASVLDPDSKRLICERFNIKDRPVYLLRLGEATKPAPHGPRLPVQKIIRPS